MNRPLDPDALPLEGTRLIDASAGTGKTWTIVRLLERLLVEKELELSQVLVVTYTRAAAAELKDRIRQRLVEARLEERPENERKRLDAALESVDQAPIGTIHSFCQKALRDFAFDCGIPFEQELLTEELPLIREVLHDWWAWRLAPASKDLAIQAFKSNKIGLDSLRVLALRYLSTPELRLLPEGDVDLDLEAVLAARAEGRKAALEALDGEIENLRAVLPGESLNRRSYKEARVAEWLEALPGLLKDPSVDLPDWFVYFTPVKIESLVKKGHQAPQHPFFAAAEALLASEGSSGLGIDRALLRDFLAYLDRELPRRKKARGLLSFGDLLRGFREALEGPGGEALQARLKERHQAALIDEFQDTDADQVAIFSRLFGSEERPLFMIGDPKQAIYAFRGADLATFFEAAEKAGEERYTLGTNWRSDPALVTGVNHLFGRSHDPFFSGQIHFDPVVPRPGARNCLRQDGVEASGLRFLLPAEGTQLPKHKRPEERLIGQATAAWVVRALQGDFTLAGEAEERPLRCSDLAVLCRTNAQGRLIQTALQERGVPCAFDGDASVFDSDEAAALELILFAMAEPSDVGALRSALSTSILGVGAPELRRLEEDDAGWDLWALRFLSWHRSWSEHGLGAAFQSLLGDCDLPERLLALRGGDRQLVNLRHLVELLQVVERQERFGPLLLVEWLHRMRQDEEFRGSFASEAAQLRLESDEEAVRITTIHRSKGLEYPLVVAPFLHGSADLFLSDKVMPRFHDPLAEGKLSLDLGGPQRKQHVEIAQEENFAEALRLLYVALTRAKHACAVIWGPFLEFKDSALAALLHGAGAPEGRGSRAAELRRKALKEMDLAAIHDELGALAAETEGAIRVERLDEEDPGAYQPDQDPIEVAPLVLGRDLQPRLRSSSYSGLTRPELEARIGHRDHDHWVEPDPSAPEVEEAASPWEILPSSASSGLAIHAILEHLSFDVGPDDPAALDLVRREMERHGLQNIEAPLILDLVRRILDTPLGGPLEGFRLRELPREDRILEMDFNLPVAQDEARAAFQADALGRVLRDHGFRSPDDDYPERIAALGFRLRGYLRGSIDLVFRREGLWYLIDWKTNRLGPSSSFYEEAALAETMASHHYELQSLLYAVALRRHLERFVGLAEARRSFCASAYLFVRGMIPPRPRGVLWRRYDPSLLDDIDAILGDASRGANS